MIAELNKSRIRAEALAKSRKKKPAAASGKKIDAVAMWKRAHAKASGDPQVSAGRANSKAAIWRKALRGDEAK